MCSFFVVLLSCAACGKMYKKLREGIHNYKVVLIIKYYYMILDRIDANIDDDQTWLMLLF